MARHNRKVIVTKIVTPIKPEPEKEWRTMQHMVVLMGLLVVLTFDDMWYTQLATVLFSGPEVAALILPVMNRAIVYVTVYCGQWVTALIGAE